MSERLGSSVHLARVGDDLVFLDVAADAYFCLPGAAEDLEVGVDGMTLVRCEPALLAELVGAGLVGPATPRDSQPRSAPPFPGARDLRGVKPPRVGATDTIPMVGSALRLYRFGHRGSLTRLLRAAGDFEARRADPGEDAVTDLALRCEQMIPWVPFQGECLFRSFLALNVLRRAGASVSWIFGVQTWPFRAHCWLQRGDLVLNDGAEYVGGYTPILSA